MSTAAVRFENVSKKFGRRLALAPTDLEIPAGEIFGLLGQNGAGKSTALGLMLGHLHPDTGRVFIAGQDISKDRRRALSRVGAIFEAPAFYDYLSAKQNLNFFTSLTGPVKPHRWEKVIDLVGLSERINDPVQSYSHGMRQRLALAQALLPEPTLLILDEPNDGLDPKGILETRFLLKKLKEEEKLTIIFSSHILSEVEQLCDRVAVLREGRLVFCGTWKDKTPPENFNVRIRCKFPEIATQVLRRAGISDWSNGGVILWPAEKDLAELSKELCSAEAGLIEFCLCRPSLEDFYFSLDSHEERIKN